MIRVASANGRFLRAVSYPEGPLLYGYHRRFGLVSEKAALARQKNRKRFGLNRDHHKGQAWICQFHLVPKEQGKFEINNGENCNITQKKDAWWVETSALSFQLSASGEVSNTIALQEMGTVWPSSGGQSISLISVVLSALFAVLLFNPWWVEKQVEEEKEEDAPVIVKVVRPRRSVTVPVPRVFKGVKSFAKNQGEENKVRRLVKQNLGFLGVLGDKKLRKVLGGTPSKLKDVSPGAGPGGKEGSGGELLVGLGKGIRKTTVGNTGTVGLGGIGTKGRGGGQGGYGNAMASSGDGLSGSLGNIALGQEIVMEGGLSQAVIKATIARYSSQVRACYEAGLQKWSGLAGMVATKFEIGPNGRLSYLKIARSTLDNEQVENCIVRNMKRWQFPHPEGGVTVKVSYPFLLRPVRL